MNKNYNTILLLAFGLMVGQNAYGMEWIKNKINDFKARWLPACASRQSKPSLQRKNAARNLNVADIIDVNMFPIATNQLQNKGEHFYKTGQTKNYWKYPTDQEGEARAQKTAQAWNNFVDRHVFKESTSSDVFRFRYADHKGKPGKTVIQHLVDTAQSLEQKYATSTIPVSHSKNMYLKLGNLICTSEGQRLLEQENARNHHKNINPMLVEQDDTTTCREEEKRLQYTIQIAAEKENPTLADLRKEIERTNRLIVFSYDPKLENRSSLAALSASVPKT